MIHCHLNWWLKFLSRKCEKTINDFHWLGLAPLCEIKLVFLLEIRWKPREQTTESRIRTKPIISSVELCWVWHPSVKYHCFSSLEIRWKPRELDCSHSLYFHTRQKKRWKRARSTRGCLPSQVFFLRWLPVLSRFCQRVQPSNKTTRKWRAVNSLHENRLRIREFERSCMWPYLQLNSFWLYLKFSGVVTLNLTKQELCFFDENVKSEQKCCWDNCIIAAPEVQLPKSSYMLLQH